MTLLNVVSFGPRDVLRRNGSLIEASTCTPSELTSLLRESDQLIREYVEKTYESDRRKAHKPDTKVRISPHFLRLTANEWDGYYLTQTSLHSRRKFFNRVDDLMPKGQSYFYAVEDAGFRPQVRLRGPNSQQGTPGVWMCAQF